MYSTPQTFCTRDVKQMLLGSRTKAESIKTNEHFVRRIVAKLQLILLVVTSVFLGHVF